MFRLLMVAIATVLTVPTFAAQITFYDNGAEMAVQPVEKVVVRGNDLYLRSSIRACAAYPGFPDKIYGDVYECYTSREKLSAHLNDMNILSLPDEDLKTYIVTIAVNLDCANRSTPSTHRYQNKNVYWFSGILLAQRL